MKWDSIDDSSWKRKVVLILSEDKFSSLAHDAEGRKLLADMNVSVVSQENDIFFNKYRQINGEIRTSGTLLVQNPFDSNSYVELKESKSAVGLERLLKTTEILQCLGATSIEVSEIRITDLESFRTMTGSLASHGVVGELSAKKGEIINLMSKINMSCRYSDAVVDLEKAIDLTQKYGLSTDSILNSLIKQRSNKGTELSVMKFEINLADGIEKTMQVITKASFPTSVVSAEYLGEAKEKYAYSLTVKVEF